MKRVGPRPVGQRPRVLTAAHRVQEGHQRREDGLTTKKKDASRKKSHVFSFHITFAREEK